MKMTKRTPRSVREGTKDTLSEGLTVLEEFVELAGPGQLKMYEAIVKDDVGLPVVHVPFLSAPLLEHPPHVEAPTPQSITAPATEAHFNLTVAPTQ